MSGLVKGNLEYPSAAKKKLISVTQKSEKKKIAESAKWDKGISKGMDRAVKVLEFMEDPKKATKSLGAGMLKEIKRKMLKHLPGRTKKTY